MTKGRIRGHYWLRFWPQDWQRDPALRSCSIAARGLWIELICIMHEATPYGYLTIGGKAATTRQIGTITGCGEKEATKLIGELEDAGVFSRDETGTIYSRRMVRDKAASDAGREHGKSGGNPALKSKSASQVNGGGNGVGLTQDLTGGPTSKKQMLESDSEPNGSAHSDPGGSAPVGAQAVDARSQLWSEGLDRLRRLTGKSDPQSRRCLGTLLKSARDDCALVNAALAEADDLRPIEPMAWLTRRIRGPDTPEFRNGFLAVIADEGMPSTEPNRFLALEVEHGKPH